MIIRDILIIALLALIITVRKPVNVSISISQLFTLIAKDLSNILNIIIPSVNGLIVTNIPLVAFLIVSDVFIPENPENIPVIKNSLNSTTENLRIVLININISIISGPITLDTSRSSAELSENIICSLIIKDFKSNNNRKRKYIKYIYKTLSVKVYLPKGVDH